MKRLILILIFLLPLSGAAKKSKRVYVEMATTMGNIQLVLYNDTPLHRDNFVKLVKEGFYDGLLFHRVIKGFMIQGGDPDSRNAAPGQLLGEGEAGPAIDAEIDPSIRHKRGCLAAAREGDAVNPERKSSSCQFYIAWGKYAHLDGKYTVFGEVTQGLDVVESINGVATDANDRPVVDVRIVKARIIPAPDKKK
mgnify:FL=1